jgi:ornithine cyclodeaminase/alanine dehydrogenase-like protein (mu-crystallin family)
MLFLTEADVRRMLPMREAMRLMRDAFQRLAAGEAVNQPRRRLALPAGSTLHYMAASDGRYFGAKIYSTHPRHGAHFLFMLYRGEDAAPLALLQANYLGQIRTGAVSGLATEVMAVPGADSAGIIGTGFQARAQLEALLLARPIRKVTVWSRSEERRARFAAECEAAFQVSVEAAASAEAAVRAAAVLATSTNARDPVLESGWVAPGTHINAIGSNQPRRRELPADLVRRADWIAVDSREQARMESGDLLLALAEGEWDEGRVVELQDVIAGRIRLRTRPDEITLFKSNGLAVEDVIAAGYIYERALTEGAGRSMDPLYS